MACNQRSRSVLLNPVRGVLLREIGRCRMRAELGSIRSVCGQYPRRTNVLQNEQLGPADPADTAKIFESWPLGGMTLKNRLLRSSISGRIDNYDGSGTPARVAFEERFAQGGVAAIISSHVPI